MKVRFRALLLFSGFKFLPILKYQVVKMRSKKSERRNLVCALFSWFPLSPLVKMKADHNFHITGKMIDDLVGSNPDVVIGEKMPLFAYVYIGMGFCE